jgi:hypothetical protein
MYRPPVSVTSGNGHKSVTEAAVATELIIGSDIRTLSMVTGSVSEPASSLNSRVQLSARGDFIGFLRSVVT